LKIIIYLAYTKFYREAHHRFILALYSYSSQSTWERN